MEEENISTGYRDIELCLDFADTVDWRTSEHPTETISDYEALVAWSLKKGVLGEEESRKLRDQVRENPSLAKGAMQDALNLREAIYRIFSATSHKKSVNPADIAILNGILSRGLGKLIVAPSGKGFDWSWREEIPPEVMLFPLAQATADLLTSGDLARVKECANEEQGCGSLFLDSSKGQTRKWCSMESCGNRVKLRAYYQRRKRKAA